MKLKEAVEIGLECGLGTLGEAIDNIFIHSMNLFPYTKIEQETSELINDLRSQGYFDKRETSLSDYIKNELIS